MAYYSASLTHFLLLLLSLSICSSYRVVGSNNQIQDILEEEGHKPALLIYNRNQKVIDQNHLMYTDITNLTQDYARLIVLDCSQNVKLDDKKQVIKGCEVMVKNEIINFQHVQGFKPADYQIMVRDKFFDVSSTVRTYKGGEMTQDNLLIFIDQLVPTYMKVAYSEEDIVNFYKNTQRLHVPKVILSTTRQEFDTVRKLAVHFFDRLEFIHQHKDTKSSLVVFKYNFNKQEFQNFSYSSLRISDYSDMKKFLEKYALKEPSPKSYDLLRPPSNDNIYTDDANLTEAFYFTEQWAIVYEGQDVHEGEKIIDIYKEKYGQFFRYIININEDMQPALYLGKQKAFKLSLTEPHVKPIETFTFSDIETRAQKLLELENAVLIVEPELFHLCSLQNIRSLVNFFFCVAVKQEDVTVVKEKFEVPNEEQLAILFSKNSSGQYNGKNLKNLTFKAVFKEAFFDIMPRLKNIAKYFMKNPFTSIPQNLEYSKFCRSASSCLLYLHNTQKPDKEQLEVLVDAAYQQNTWMMVSEGDYRCHQELFDSLKKKSDKLLLFINDTQFVSYDGKLTPKVMGKLIRSFKTNTLKMKPLNENLKTREKCAYKMQPIDKVLAKAYEESVEEEMEDFQNTVEKLQKEKQEEL